jgi:hypothetical protein
MRTPLVLYDFAPIPLNFLIYEKKLYFLFISVQRACRTHCCELLSNLAVGIEYSICTQTIRHHPTRMVINRLSSASSQWMLLQIL